MRSLVPRLPEGGWSTGVPQVHWRDEDHKLHLPEKSNQKDSHSAEVI